MYSLFEGEGSERKKDIVLTIEKKMLLKIYHEKIKINIYISNREADIITCPPPAPSLNQLSIHGQSFNIKFRATEFCSNSPILYQYLLAPMLKILVLNDTNVITLLPIISNFFFMYYSFINYIIVLHSLGFYTLIHI